MPGPLAGLRIIELAGIGPGPFAGMMLADHGAEVIRVERPGTRVDARDPLLRSRRTIAVDLKSADGIALVRDLAKGADGFFEGFRPGVTERLGLGPDVLLSENPRLVYGRMTGWGQTGPYAHAAGHDINYIALAGALHGYGRAGDKPTPPINMVGDFGGGGMMLAFGMVSALLHAAKTGEGQVIDVAMTDGAAVLSAMIWGFRANGIWGDERGVNMLGHRRALLRHLRSRRRQVAVDRQHRAAILCRAAPAGGPRRRPRIRRADGPRGVGTAQGQADRAVPDPEPRRVVRSDGNDRCLLCTGAEHGRGTGPCAQRRARHLRRGGRRHPAGPGAALLAK